MSFQTNQIWSNTEFTNSKSIWNNLVSLDNLDNETVIVVSNLEGSLHVFKENEVIVSKNYKQPVLKLLSGNFITALKKKSLVILHPYNLQIVFLDYNTNTEHYELVQAFSHNLTDPSYSFCNNNGDRF